MSLSVLWNIQHEDSRDYLRSLYWILTTTNAVGYGDIVPKDIQETLYFFVIALAGFTLNAAVIAAITDSIQSIEIAETNLEFRKMVSCHFLAEEGYYGGKLRIFINIS